MSSDNAEAVGAANTTTTVTGIEWVQDDDRKFCGSLTRVVAANAVAEVPDEWSRLPKPIIIDSGACDSVMPPDWAPNYEAQSSGREGVTLYVAASGELIPNEGQKILNLCTPSGEYAQLQFQLAPVHQALCSVSGLCKAGNRVVFEDGHGYIQNVKTKKKTWLEERDGLYVLDPHVAPTNEPGFARQA